MTWAEEADIVDRIKFFNPKFDHPLTPEATHYVVDCRPCDSRESVEELGIAFRPTEETLGDAIRWMAENGHLDPK